MMIIKLNSYEGEIAVKESVCSDPMCDCMDLTLIFHQMKKNDIVEPLFRIAVDTDSWQVTEKEKYKEDVNFEEMINEFMNGLDDKAKATLKDRVLVAKGEEEPIDWLDNMDVYDTPLIGYSEVFGEKTASIGFFYYDGLDYFVNDCYCINPKCKCNDCMLIFSKNCHEKKHLIEKFVIHLEVNNGKYKIRETGGISEGEIADTVAAFLEHLGGLSLLRKRYKKMKDFGKKRIKRRKKRRKTINKSRKATAKVSRNAPCPCGSGKKYKRCCGK